MYRLDIYENNETDKILMTQWFDTFSEAKDFAESVRYIREHPYTITNEEYVTEVLA